MVKHTTENFASEEMAKKIQDVFKKEEWPGTARTVEQSLETVLLNERWLNRDLDGIRQFLAAYN